MGNEGIIWGPIDVRVWVSDADTAGAGTGEEGNAMY
jgi:hypothetical protein